jgi:hypothetical protein
MISPTISALARAAATEDECSPGSIFSEEEDGDGNDRNESWG